MDVAILVRELVERVRPYARDLGNEAWLAPIDGLLDHPSVDDVVDAFESGGAAAALATCRVRADEVPEQVADQPADEVTADETDRVDA